MCPLPHHLMRYPEDVNDETPSPHHPTSQDVAADGELLKDLIVSDTWGLVFPEAKVVQGHNIERSKVLRRSYLTHYSGKQVYLCNQLEFHQTGEYQDLT